YILFFSSYTDNLYLHSFPTRRSSDLNAKNNFVSFGNLFSYGFKSTAIATLFIIICLVIVIVALPDFKQKILDAMRKGMEDQGKRDRKSTRLNSSHVAISYAVFCLKKK